MQENEKTSDDKFDGVRIPVSIDGGNDCSSDKLSNLNNHIEKENIGGYFPIGLNGLWHGGVHLKTNVGDPVTTSFDGTIIAARLAEDVNDYFYGSGNFILLKHSISGSQVKQFTDNENHESDDSDEHSFYSLYMHLNNEALDKGNSNLADVKWIQNEQKQKELNASVGEKGQNKKDDVITVQEMLQELGEYSKAIDGDCGRGTKQAIYNFQKGFMNHPDSLIEKGGRSWGKLVEAVGGESNDNNILEELKSGSVVKIEKPVKAGDVLWTAGEFGIEDYKGSMVHWEIFSEKLLFKNWNAIEDNNKKYSLESSTKVSDIEAMANGLSSIDSVVEFYKNNPDAEKIRRYSFKFCNEWAVDPKASVDAIKDRYIVDQVADQIALYMWWKEALDAGVSLPSSPVVWHYNPVSFLEDSAVAFLPIVNRSSVKYKPLSGAHFDLGKSFLRPSCIDEMSKITEMINSNQNLNVAIFGHTDVSGSAKNNKELAYKRARIMKAAIENKVEEWFELYKTEAWGIKEAQYCLKTQGYNVEISGKRCNATNSAIKEFRKKSDLTESYYLGADGWLKLLEGYLEIISPKISLSNKMCKIGDDGIVSCGEANPIINTYGPEAANRRTIVAMLNDISNIPCNAEKCLASKGQNENVEILSCKFYRDNINESTGEIELKAKWSVDEAREGDHVALIVEGEMSDGMEVEFSIYEDDEYNDDEQIISGKKVIAKDGRAEFKWIYQYFEDKDDVSLYEEVNGHGLQFKDYGAFNLPEYYFVAKVGNSEVRSPILDYKTTLEIKINETYTDNNFIIYHSKGIIKGKLDSGVMIAEDVPPGDYTYIVKS